MVCACFIHRGMATDNSRVINSLVLEADPVEVVQATGRTKYAQ